MDVNRYVMRSLWVLSIDIGTHRWTKQTAKKNWKELYEPNHHQSQSKSEKADFWTCKYN